MRLFYQIENNTDYNGLYSISNTGINAEALPTGYGAMPFSHGFVHNKYSAKPWGIKIPGTYSRLAHPGLHFLVDETNTDIYQVASTGIGSSITGTIPGINSTQLVGNPFNYGPVSIIYDVVVSGVTEVAGHVSGCGFCDLFNRNYTVFLDAIGLDAANAIPGQNIQVTDFDDFNSTMIWRGAYCQEDEAPRRNICSHETNLTVTSAPSNNVNLFTPTLTLAQMNSNLVGQNFGTSPHFSGNVILKFAVEANPSVFGFRSDLAYQPIISFHKDYGGHEVFNPFPTHQNRPHMMDYKWIGLNPSIDRFYFSHAGTGLTVQPAIDPGLAAIRNQACDFSSAKAYVRPHIPEYSGSSFYYLKNGMFNYADRSVMPMLNDEEYELNTGLNRNIFSGLVPFNFQFKIVNVPNYNIYAVGTGVEGVVPQTGIEYRNYQNLYCESCSGYYDRYRDLSLSLIEHIPLFTIFHTAEVYNRERLSIPGATSSGFALSLSYINYGYNGIPFREYNPIGGTEANKRRLHNLTNICEFGCNESESERRYNPNNYCNNFFTLHFVKQWAVGSSGLLHDQLGSGTYGVNNGYAYLYLGFRSTEDATVGDTSLSTNTDHFYFPYRFKKQICSSTGLFDSFGTGVVRLPPCSLVTGIAALSENQQFGGTINWQNNLSVLSGGWTYEIWDTGRYIPSFGLGNPIRNSFNDVSGLCSLASGDVIVIPSYHRDRVSCKSYDVCAPCVDAQGVRQVPTTATVSFTIPSKTFILDLQSMSTQPEPGNNELNACRWEYNAGGESVILTGPDSFNKFRLGAYFDGSIGGVTNCAPGSNFCQHPKFCIGSYSLGFTGDATLAADVTLPVPQAPGNPRLLCSNDSYQASGLLTTFINSGGSCLATGINTTITVQLGDLINAESIM